MEGRRCRWSNIDVKNGKVAIRGPVPVSLFMSETNSLFYAMLCKKSRHGNVHIASSHLYVLLPGETLNVFLQSIKMNIFLMVRKSCVSVPPININVGELHMIVTTIIKLDCRVYLVGRRILKIFGHLTPSLLSLRPFSCYLKMTIWV